ncbi:22825_t:CDS:2, partial [Gigaspora margarita]
MSTKKCNNCDKDKDLEEFLKDETIIDYSNISEFIYNSLISLENINEFYKNDDVELAIDFDIELSSVIDIILNENDKNFVEDEKLYLETVKIKVFASLNLIKIKYSYLMLHPRSIHIAISLKIWEFIKNNINYLVPELYYQIKEKQLNGHENFTIQQTYFWWSKKSQRIYQYNSDPLISAKLLLAEFNQEIDLSIPTPALGFLTALFYKLPCNNFKLYALMGVINRTGFPLSYLLIAIGKNQNIIAILSQWIYAFKYRQLDDFSYILMDKNFCKINAAQK